MKKQIVALVLGVAVIGGVGVGIAANALSNDEPARPTTGSSPTTTATESGLKPVSSLVVKPGSVGPVRIGMSNTDALATDYLVPGEAGVDGCPTPALTWAKAYRDQLDVVTRGGDDITSIGIRGTGPRTSDGLGVGSTYGELKKVADGPLEAGYNQSGMSINDPKTGGFVGFLFNEPVDDLTDASKVTFVEVTKGFAPSLVRDGC